MKETEVTFRSGELTLEALLANPAGDSRAAVVCHPHPMYGGSMYNNVVDAVLDGLWQAGYATLRFNFRGVGASEGEHDGGPGEVDDAIAAATFLVSQPGVRKDGLIMAGYSFGAMVAVSAGYETAEIARIVAVALPLAMADVRIPEGSSKPILLVSGDRDSYSPVNGVRALKEKIGDSARVEIVAGADHFFGGSEKEVARVIGELLKEH
ncbi:MAG TPA: alpha/beta family hydrolase [Candidatus Binatus sp.]|nr:alpha/beta family hydrolase [Candidatus Binatus sp.]